MIRTHSIVSGSDYIELNWTHPKFLPEKYKLKYVCTKNPTCTPVLERYYNIITSARNLSSDTTVVRVSNLRPSSICTLFLLAVYNQASTDSGIWIPGTTLDENKSKKHS